MIESHGRYRRLCVVAALTILLTACEEFSTEAPLRVEIQEAAAWPDTLDLAEIAALAVEILDGEGRALTGVELDWQTSDSLILELSYLAPPEGSTRRDSLEARLTAIVATHNPGSAEIIVRVDRPGIEPAELRVPLVVVRRGWPSPLTVTGVDTVGIAVEHADETVVGDLEAEWASSDPSVLKVRRLDADPLRATVTAHASGTADVVVALGGERLDPTVFSVPITVSPMLVAEAEPWPAAINVTDVDTIEVEIRDASGDPVTGAEVYWRSSNEVAVAVVPLDGYQAEVRALTRGVAEVIVTAGGLEFQTAEYRRSIRVLQKWGSVDAGYGHTCALAIDGTAYCWGRNIEGELGVGDFVDRSVPEPVATFLNFQEIKAGGIGTGSVHDEQAHTCGRLGGRVECWGSFSRGQLGDGSGPCNWFDHPSECGQPVPVEAVLDPGDQAVSLAVGGRYTCVGKHEIWPGEVSCWGELDTATVGWDPSAGGDHVCTHRDAEAFCIGKNSFGQLGDGTTVDRLEPSEPVQIAADQLLFARPSAGGEHTCAVTYSTRRVWCWGSNISGQLGTTAATGDCSGPPCSVWAIPVQGLDIDVGSVTAGTWHTCALAAGDVYCWGANSVGQLGNGTPGPSSAVPVLVEGGHEFTSISAGGAHTCGVTTDGSIYCWGSNGRGQLGNGTTTPAPLPVRVSEPGS